MPSTMTTFLGGPHLHRVLGAVVNGIVVHRAVDGLACAQRLQILHHEVGIEGVRVVVVELAALLIGQLVVALVVAVVVENADLVRTKMVPQLFGQGGLAAAGAARDADNDGSHVHSSLYIQFDLAPRRLIRAVFDAGHVEHAAAGDAGMGVVVFVR